jgi:hypothetical protein
MESERAKMGLALVVVMAVTYVSYNVIVEIMTTKWA